MFRVGVWHRCELITRKSRDSRDRGLEEPQGAKSLYRDSPQEDRIAI